MASTDYSKRKNAELEELLKARGLPHTGKKAELVARLQAADAEPNNNQHRTTNATTAEDEIDWDDDAAAAGAATTAPAAAAIAAGGQVQPPNPVAVSNQVPAQDPSAASDLTVKAPSSDDQSAAAAAAAADVTDPASTSSVPAADAPPAQDFSSHIPGTSLTAELEKRKARAARFGLPTTTAEENNKALERAKRFGLDKAPEVEKSSETTPNTAVAGLDRALPERERKRGRGGRGIDDGQDGGGGKRRDSRRRDGKGAGAGGRSEGGRKNGAGTGAGVRKTGGAGEMSEKDRSAAEARKKRFAAAAAV